MAVADHSATELIFEIKFSGEIGLGCRVKAGENLYLMKK